MLKSNETYGHHSNVEETKFSNDNTAFDNNDNNTESLEHNINFNDFFDFLNLTCHVSDMISQKNDFGLRHHSSQQQRFQPSDKQLQKLEIYSPKLNLKKIPSCKSSKSFSSIQIPNKNHYTLLDNLCSNGKTARAIAEDFFHGDDSSICKSSNSNRSETTSGCNHGNCDNLLTFDGNWDKCSPKSMHSLHSSLCNELQDSAIKLKLDEKLDFVLNEGILDSVLPFICPVPLPANFTPRLKPKNKDLKPVVNSNNFLETKEISATATSVTMSPSKLCSPSTSSTSTVSTAVPNNLNTTHKIYKTNESTNTTKITKDEKETNIHSKFGNRQQSSEKKRSIVENYREYKANKERLAANKTPDIIIHVCDEVKNITCDFTCPQDLLLKKMRYFSTVTDGQDLHDMDISVHCDLQIFEWLMQWVKSHNEDNNCLKHPWFGPTSTLAQPQLNANNVVSILVSANFLQMEPLLMDCLQFCHVNLSEVIRAGNTLSNLNDAIITRLAAMFTNIELESIDDQNNRLTPKLWVKLIQSLFEPEPETLRGHFYTLAGLFNCSKCNKCLTNTVKSYVSCISSNMRLNRWGQLYSSHDRETTWDLNCYISQLFKDLKSWRLVYWKLWGHGHYLYCCLCETHFPAYEMSWCRYHPENPIFLGPITEGRMAGPLGRYPCCGQQTYRFETLPFSNGCQYRDHSVLLDTDRERSILAILQVAIEHSSIGESPSWRQQELISKGDTFPNWWGLPLILPHSRPSLLPMFKPRQQLLLSNRSGTTDSSTESDSFVANESGRKKLNQIGAHGCESSISITSSLTTSDDAYDDDDDQDDDLPRKRNNNIKNNRNPSVKKKINKQKCCQPSSDFCNRYWSDDLSARSNQDNQRNYEERILKQMSSIMEHKFIKANKPNRDTHPFGGTYVRLEQEWKEQNRLRYLTLYPAPSTSTLGTIQSGTHHIQRHHKSRTGFGSSISATSTNISGPATIINDK